MRLLIVEDEKRMAELLKKGFEEENHSVSLAHDGPTAVELAELYEFDAIVLDLMLPGLDGYEVARRLRPARNRHAYSRSYHPSRGSGFRQGVGLGNSAPRPARFCLTRPGLYAIL